MIYSNCWKKNFQPKILYPATLSFRVEGERVFQISKILKEYIFPKPALPERLTNKNC